MQLLAKAHNMLGPLSNERKAEIAEYLHRPSVEGWDRIHSLVVREKGRVCTVWQACIRLDPKWADIAIPYSNNRRPKDPKHRWTAWPDAVTLGRALKKALDG